AGGDVDRDAVAVYGERCLAALEGGEQVEFQFSFHVAGHRSGALETGEILPVPACLEAGATESASCERPAEQTLEEVTESSQVVRIHALEAGAGGGPAEALGTALAAVLVIEAALLLVVQHRVGLVDFLEALLGRRVIRIAVGV